MGKINQNTQRCKMVLAGCVREDNHLDVPRKDAYQRSGFPSSLVVDFHLVHHGINGYLGPFLEESHSDHRHGLGNCILPAFPQPPSSLLRSHLKIISSRRKRIWNKLIQLCSLLCLHLSPPALGTWSLSLSCHGSVIGSFG